MGYKKKFFLGITTKNTCASFNCKSQAAKYLGVAVITINRWMEKIEPGGTGILEYKSKKKGKCFRLYFNAELYNKTGKVY